MKASESYIRKIAEEGKRLDGRPFDQFRKISIETNVLKNAEGSARVRIGNTHVLVGVKMSVGEPFPDAPNEGVLMVNAELSPIASPTFEPGPPSEDSVELARVVDRGIRESNCIDLEKLCITEGEKIWIVNVDIQIIDHDGNLIDAGSIGAMAALLNANVPKYEDEKINLEESSGPLPMKDSPIEITTVKIGDRLLLDATAEEEEALNARLTLAVNESDCICAAQKGGRGYFTKEEIAKAVDLSILKSKEIRNMIKG